MKFKMLALATASLVAVAAPLSAAKPVYGDWGYNPAAMDSSVKPGDDFWAYVNGTWDKKTYVFLAHVEDPEDLPDEAAAEAGFHMLRVQFQCFGKIGDGPGVIHHLPACDAAMEPGRRIAGITLQSLRVIRHRTGKISLGELDRGAADPWWRSAPSSSGSHPQLRPARREAPPVARRPSSARRIPSSAQARRPDPPPE